MQCMLDGLLAHFAAGCESDWGIELLHTSFVVVCSEVARTPTHAISLVASCELRVSVRGRLAPVCSGTVERTPVTLNMLSVSSLVHSDNGSAGRALENSCSVSGCILACCR